MLCPRCATEIPDNSHFCPECGADTKHLVEERSRDDDAPNRVRDLTLGLVYPRNPPRSPHLALLTLLLPGLPQLLFGQKGKGLILFGIYVAGVTWAGALISFAIVMVAIIDAYKVGYALSNLNPIGKWAWFP